MEYDPFSLEPSWRQALAPELSKPYIAHLMAFVERERLGAIPVYPPAPLVFNAFWQTPYHKVKVLIMGQDPYHGPGQAHGLSFSVPEGVAIPHSLQNIYKEIASDLHLTPPNNGCLLHWAQQGVLLLNATLTVRQSEPMSHHGKGWEQFTDAVVDALCARKDPLIFVLWGNSAKKKCLKVQNHPHHVVLTAAHPSPLSAHQGFLGCHHFSQINQHLKKQNKTPINWV